MRSDERYLDFIVTCCAALEVDIFDVIARGKGCRPVLEARQFIAWALRKRWQLSLSHIGNLMNRDHTTVLSSIRKVQRALDGAKPWAMECQRLCIISPPGTLVTESALDSLRAMSA